MSRCVAPKEVNPPLSLERIGRGCAVRNSMLAAGSRNVRALCRTLKEQHNGHLELLITARPVLCSVPNSQKVLRSRFRSIVTTIFPTKGQWHHHGCHLSKRTTAPYLSSTRAAISSSSTSSPPSQALSRFQASSTWRPTSQEAL